MRDPVRNPNLVEDLIKMAKKLVIEMDYYYDFTDVAPSTFAEEHEKAREDVRKVLRDLGVKV